MSVNDTQGILAEENKAEENKEKKKSIYDVFGSGSDTSQYLSDETDYIDYDDKEEALLVLIPIEQSDILQNKPQETEKKSPFSLGLSFHSFSEFFASLSSFLNRLGESTAKITVSVLVTAIAIIKIPFILIWQKIFLKSADFIHGKLYVKSKKWKLKDFKLFKEDVKRTLKKAEEKKHEGYKASFSLLLSNLKSSFSKHKRVWVTVSNIIIPVGCLFVLLLTAVHFSDATYALEVNYNGENIGYIKNQSVFNTAKESAVKRLSVTSDQVDIAEPTYKVTMMTPDKLSDANAMCDQIIEHTDGSYINACGIYIDGEFVCAIKSEADAISVFDSILEPYEEGAGKNATVAFVQEISYVQGYYNDNNKTIWNTEKLRDEMNSQKSKAVYYTVEEDDTLTSIASKNNIYLSELKKLNPDVKEESIHVGDKILISAQVNYIRVKVMKTESRTNTLYYETETKNSSSLYKGTSKTVQEGSNGKEKITELVTYIDGIKTYSSTISTKVISQPINKIIERGTKEVVSSYTTPSSNYTGDYSEYKQGDGNTTYTGGGFGPPLASSYSITSGYGYRDPSISGWSFHGGTDFINSSGATTGTGVLAVQAGTVVSVQQSYSGYGYSVLISHGNGLQTRYAHMQAGSICVSVGQSVSKGQQIGRAGGTGNVTGPHLHFEVIKNGTRVNPMSYF